MPTMTLLEMTQNILSAMSSDEVNSISDTVESLQVAEEIRNTYNDQYSTRDLSRNKGMVNLEPTTALSPHVMTVPTKVVNVEWIKYKNFGTTNLTFNEIEYVDPEEFVKRFVEKPQGAIGTYDNIVLVPGSALTFPVPNNKAPEFYTFLDQNRLVVFDSYDLANEAFLSAQNSIAWGTISQEFDLNDAFIPPIPVHAFPLLLAEAKSACFVNYKETNNPIEERRARRQLVRGQTINDAARDQNKNPFDASNYGRNR